MTGFFRKLLGKKEEDTTSQDDGGSWTEHEISVEIQTADDIQEASEKQEVLPDTKLNSSDAMALDTKTTDTQPIATLTQKDFVSKASDIQAEITKTGETVQLEVLNIPTIDAADLKLAMDQVEEATKLDPLDEITAQIQSELAAERSAKEKKETLDKLIEITNQLRRPEFDEDFDV